MSPQGAHTLGARHVWAQGSVLGVFNKLPRRNQLFVIVHPVHGATGLHTARNQERAFLVPKEKLRQDPRQTPGVVKRSIMQFQSWEST